MKVIRLIAKNWKNFLELDVTFSDRMFLIGPNASGKSNFLDIFLFLHDIVKQGGGLQKAIDERGGMTKMRCLSARRYPDIEIEIHLGDKYDQKPIWKYIIAIRQEGRAKHQHLIRAEKIYHKDGFKRERPNQQDISDPTLLLSTHLEQPQVNREFRQIAQFFQSIKYFHLVPQLIKYPQAFQGKGIPEDPFGQHFLDYIAETNPNIRNRRFKKIQEILQFLVPQLQELKFQPDVRGRPHIAARYDHWRPRAGKQREEQFSDGTLRLIGLLWSLLDVGDSLLLLEEPEISLNSEIIRVLPLMIERIQAKKKKRNQIIIGTHSWELLSDLGISADEILVFRPTHEGTIVKSASAITELKKLLETGMPPSDAVFPYIAPKKYIKQRSLLEFL